MRKQTALCVQVGRAPKLQFYAFGSPEIGSFIRTTANGSLAAASTQAGLQNWTDHLSSAAKESIISRWYGNTREAVQKFRDSSEANRQTAVQLFPTDITLFEADNFTTDGFLVRHYSFTV